VYLNRKSEEKHKEKHEEICIWREMKECETAHACEIDREKKMERARQAK
jgi:hypothetical protein